MPLTHRSRLLNRLLLPLRAGIRSAHLAPNQADDALQQSLLALIPHVEKLSAMPARESAAYAYVVGSRTAMALRKRVGLERARGTDEEVEAWYKRVTPLPTTPEEWVCVAQGAERAARVFDEFPTDDRKIVAAVSDDGLSEREVARELDISRGNVAYRLRRARHALSRAWLGTTSWVRKERSVR